MNLGARNGQAVPASYRHSTYYSYIQSSPVNVLAVKSKRSLSFEIWVFRNGQPDRDDDSKIFVAMTSTKKQRILVWVAFASASELQNITTLGTSSKITYELWNVISIRWWCWNVATDERDVDYWKSEIITFVVDFFKIFLRCWFQGEGQGKKQTFECQ
jgi:hypothetical protein